MYLLKTVNLNYKLEITNYTRTAIRILKHLLRGCSGGGYIAQNPDSDPILEAWLAKTTIHIFSRSKKFLFPTNSISYSLLLTYFINPLTTFERM